MPMVVLKIVLIHICIIVTEVFPSTVSNPINLVQITLHLFWKVGGDKL